VRVRTIPVEVDELTPDWFTSALRAHAPDVRVAAVDIVDAHSGTTGRVKVALTYEGDRRELPGTLFLKIAPFDPRQRAFLDAVGIGVMEARLYAEIAHELPVRLPRPWHAAFDDDGRFVMVIEDIEASGCTFPRPADPDIAERAASTVEELALLHAQYWESPRFAADLAWVPDRAGFGAGGGKDKQAPAAAGQFIHLALDRFADEMPPVFREIGLLYAERAGGVLDLWDEGERTLIHGDPHSGNLFTDRGRAGFFDWAMFSHSPGMRDIAYYCCNSNPTDVRRAVQDDLLARYRGVLSASGVELDAAVMEHQYRLFAVYSWVSAASTAAMGNRWQPSHRAIAALHRTTDAIADLDSVGLLREALA
jgi:hypothetical protein